jgi:ubiquinone/menaquinone biosynthesis C-methylase UbiE
MAALDPKPGERVLDVGCGAGQTVVQLAEAVGPAGEVVGIDIAPLLGPAAFRKLRSAGLGRGLKSSGLSGCGWTIQEPLNS